MFYCSYNSLNWFYDHRHESLLLVFAVSFTHTVTLYCGFLSATGLWINLHVVFGLWEHANPRVNPGQAGLNTEPAVGAPRCRPDDVFHPEMSRSTEHWTESWYWKQHFKQQTPAVVQFMHDASEIQQMIRGALQDTNGPWGLVSLYWLPPRTLKSQFTWSMGNINIHIEPTYFEL